MLSKVNYICSMASFVHDRLVWFLDCPTEQLSVRYMQSQNHVGPDVQGPGSNGATAPGYETDDDFLEVQGIQVHVS